MRHASPDRDHSHPRRSTRADLHAPSHDRARQQIQSEAAGPYRNPMPPNATMEDLTPICVDPYMRDPYMRKSVLMLFGLAHDRFVHASVAAPTHDLRLIPQAAAIWSKFRKQICVQISGAKSARSTCGPRTISSSIWQDQSSASRLVRKAFRCSMSTLLANYALPFVISIPHDCGHFSTVGRSSLLSYRMRGRERREGQIVRY